MDFNLLHILDLLGTIVFAITGAVKATRYKLDFLGVLILACVVGVGGGLTRDVILGSHPVAAFNDFLYLTLCGITAIIVFYTSHLYTSNKWKIVRFFDAIGLGLFTALGASKAEDLGVSSVGIVVCALVSATGGGIMRDLFIGSIPVILTADFYATAALLGGILYLIMMKIGLDHNLKLIICSIFVSSLRLLAMKYNLHLPKARESSNDIIL